MAVDHAGGAAILGRPVVAHRQPELVGLAGGLPVQAELPHGTGAAPLHLLLQPGVGHNQIAAIQHVVADQGIQELRDIAAHAGAPILGERLDLGKGGLQPVVDLHVPSAQGSQQLGVVVAGQAEGGAGLDHGPHDPQGVEGAWAAIHQVAEEHRPAAVGMRVDWGGIAEELRLARGGVAETGEQRLQLAGTAVLVTDYVEWTMLTFAVVPKRLAIDRRRSGLLHGREGEDVAEALAAQPAQRVAQVGGLPAYHMGAKVAVRARGIPIVADALGDIEDDGHRQAVVAARKLHKRAARSMLHVGGVDHSQPAGGESLRGDVVEDLEGVVRSGLVVFVIRDKGAAEVGGDGLGGQEVGTCEGALAGAGGPDQHHQRELGYGQLHRVLPVIAGAASPSCRVKTAICEGAPAAGSSGPSGEMRTA